MGGQQYKNVGLGKVLGIGGEGIVIQEELEITVKEGDVPYEKLSNLKKAENIRLESEGKRQVALKFVPFAKEDRENFKGQGLIIQKVLFNNLNQS